MLAAGPLPPPSRPSGPASQRHMPALCELLVVNAVALWAAVLLVLDQGHHEMEALLIILLTLLGHAGLGPSQLRFGNDAGVGVGLTGGPCFFASLYIVSKNALLRSLLHASLLCSVSTAVHHFLCFPFSDIPSRSTSFARFTTFTSKFFVLSFRLMLPWPDRVFSIVAMLIYECFMWALTEVPLFSSSFTLGEAVLVLQTLALAMADLLLVTLIKFGMYGSGIMGANIRGSRDSLSLVLECGLVGAIASGAAILPLFCHEVVKERWEANSTYLARALPTRTNPAGAECTGILSTLTFIGVVAGYVGLVMFPWMGFLIQQNPLVWLFEFFLEDVNRFKMCSYWVILILVFTQGIVPFSTRFKLKRIIVRKLFHVLAVLLFLPATVYQPQLLALSYGVAMSIMIVLEYVRMSRKVLPTGASLHKFYTNFLDEKDMGNLVVTHIYLLYGCAFPLWSSLIIGHDANPLVAYAGILALGVGDAAAASVGTYFGLHRWPASNRTIEGSGAMALAMIVGILIVEQIEKTSLYANTETSEVMAMLMAVLLQSLLEAFTCQIDNLVLPVYGVILFNLAYRVVQLSPHQHLRRP